jgi:hypothetical protein
MANLLLAAQSLSWGDAVEFISEGENKTPDFRIDVDGGSLFVECTSVDRPTEDVDDASLIRRVVAEAWHEKKRKFSRDHCPGVITADISGIYLSREWGTHLRAEHVRRVDLPVRGHGKRTIGLYNVAGDFDLLARESQTRDLLGLLASALHSADARERGIKGFLAYQGQEVVVDIARGGLRRPQRGVLAWAGAQDDPGLVGAIHLAQPPIPVTVPLGEAPPVYVFFV